MLSSNWRRFKLDKTIHILLTANASKFTHFTRNYLVRENIIC